MTPDHVAATRPESTAIISAETGITWSFQALAQTSSRWANALRSMGVKPDDRLAILAPNRIEAFGAYFAALRTGARYVPINWHLRAEEAGYILDDSGATILLAHASMASLAQTLAGGRSLTFISFGGDITGFDRLETLATACTIEPTATEVEGAVMLYSSGTTGKPKGIVHDQVPTAPYGTVPLSVRSLADVYDIGPTTVYLCPAPIYHAAPLIWAMTVIRMGGTVVLMEKFDAEEALGAIDRFAVTLAQFVPTHFVRMLRLPASARNRYKLRSLARVVHAAAPCPVGIKRQMLEWLGLRIFEFYSGSEGAGMTAIGPEEWLQHPGSVGKPVYGSVHILDDHGFPLPAGLTGSVYFSGGAAFSYHNDGEQTQQSRSANGLSTLGDIGHVDEHGYLYLTDRRSHMIISGGVNIYPQEVEDLLLMHPDIEDAAVIGVPDQDMGEAVRAVIKLSETSSPRAGLDQELIRYCRSGLAAYKCPRAIDFVEELPRLENGKLLKRELRRKYWPQ